MESLELRIFREVARAGSISKAAERLGYVQSNVTAHMKRLENELNAALLIRHHRGVTLTADGEKLLRRAERIVSLLDETAALFKPAASSLRIGATQTIAGYLLPPLLVAYRREHPGASLSVETPDERDMERRLSDGSLDCVVTNSIHSFARSREIRRMPERLRIVAPASCETEKELCLLPLVVNRLPSCPYRNALLDWNVSECSAAPEIMEFDTVEGIVRAVSLGAGISLLPAHAVPENGRVRVFQADGLRQTFIRIWIGEGRKPADFEELAEGLEKILTQARA
ncbi:LysR family transcriptional regulator [Saccharibacillus sp. CPCC 101409]|uniref:LysR family transcriptional regulator n=1 Tax=Saccharibacillus sp. CPCC 101409 TaxID=3058041 RepID=UPI00267100C6|nr:LysR family transcriptional regulator [Saccharibacillus sp. CPCC 101409]MDO3411864.1 LysR family transcriptional regulator [Saccharibacillus sp. CPCC 101409]